MTWGDLQKLLGQAGQKAGQVVQGAQNAVQQGEQAFGGQLAQTPVTSIPGSPTWQQVGQAVTQNPLYQAAQQFKQANEERGYQLSKQIKPDLTRDQYNKINQATSMIAGTAGSDMAMESVGSRTGAQVVADRGKFTTSNIPRTNTYAPQVEELPNPGENGAPTPTFTRPTAPTTPTRPTTENPYSYTPNGQATETTYGPPPSTNKLPPVTRPQAPTTPYTPSGSVDTANIAKIQARDFSKSSSARTFKTPDIQATYTRLGVSNPDDVANIKQSLYQNVINPDLAQNPVRIPLEGDAASGQVGLIDKIVTRMQELDPNLTPQAARNAAEQSINRLVGSAQQEVGGLAPGGVSMKAINDESTLLSKSGAWNDYITGTRPTTPGDVAAVASKEVLRDTVSSQNPVASQAIRDYGNLEEGFPSYAKASDAANALPSPPSLVSKMTKAGLAVGGVGLAAGAGLAGYTILNSRQKDESPSAVPATPGVKGPVDQTGQNQQGNGYIDHTSTSIPQSMDDIAKSKNADGTYNVIDPTNIKGADGQPIVINKNDFNQQYSQLNSQITQLQGRATAEQTTDPIQSNKDNGAAIALQGQQNSLVNKMNQSGEINDLTQKTASLNKVMADAQKRIAAGANDPSLTNLLSAQGMSLDILAQTQNGKYSQLAKELKYIEQQVGGPGTIFVPGSQTSVLLGNLDLANKLVLNGYYNQINQYTGGSATSVNPSGQNQTATTPGATLPPIQAGPPDSGDMTHRYETVPLTPNALPAITH